MTYLDLWWCSISNNLWLYYLSRVFLLCAIFLTLFHLYDVTWQRTQFLTCRLSIPGFFFSFNRLKFDKIVINHLLVSKHLLFFSRFSTKAFNIVPVFSIHDFSNPITPFDFHTPLYKAFGSFSKVNLSAKNVFQEVINRSPQEITKWTGNVPFRWDVLTWRTGTQIRTVKIYNKGEGILESDSERKSFLSKFGTSS